MTTTLTLNRDMAGILAHLSRQPKPALDSKSTEYGDLSCARALVSVTNHKSKLSRWHASRKARDGRKHNAQKARAMVTRSTSSNNSKYDKRIAVEFSG